MILSGPDCSTSVKLAAWRTWELMKDSSVFGLKIVMISVAAALSASWLRRPGPPTPQGGPPCCHCAITAIAARVLPRPAQGRRRPCRPSGTFPALVRHCQWHCVAAPLSQVFMFTQLEFSPRPAANGQAPGGAVAAVAAAGCLLVGPGQSHWHRLTFKFSLRLAGGCQSELYPACVAPLRAAARLSRDLDSDRDGTVQLGLGGLVLLVGTYCN